MKRTTVVLSDQVSAVLEMERRRRGLSTAALIREAVEHYLFDQQEPLWFIGIGQSDGSRSLGAEAEDILAEEWADYIAEDSGLAPRKHNAARSSTSGSTSAGDKPDTALQGDSTEGSDDEAMTVEHVAS